MSSASLYLVNQTRSKNKHRLDNIYFLFLFSYLVYTHYDIIGNFNPFFNLISFSLSLSTAYFDLLFTSSVFSLQFFSALLLVGSAPFFLRQ